MGDTPRKPGPVNPTFVPRSTTPLWRATLADASRVMTLDANPKAPRPGAPLRFEPPPALKAAESRASFFGPTYAALTQGFGGEATLDDQLRAQAALAVVPALLLASAAKPVADRVYSLIERIPDAVQRPFHKLFGILLDSGMGYATGAANALIDASVRGFAPGAALPSQVELPIDAYSQLDSSCGETAVAMILKAAGEPVLLGEVDTQLTGPMGIPGVGGVPSVASNTLSPDREFARRGLSAISGSSDLPRLKQFVASGFPVLVSVGWQSGGGHFAVVSGFNEAKGELTIRNWAADGKTVTVPYATFSECWARHLNLMTAVVPQRDPRMASLLKQSDPRRESVIAKGFSIADFWCDEKRLFVEAAYRYVTADTDVTLRVAFNSEGLKWGEADELRWLNGSIAVRQRVASGWFVGFRVEKLSLRKEKNEWETFHTTPIGAALTVEGPGFQLAVAAERGAVQASFAANLGQRLADLGLKVNVAVSDTGTYQVMGVLAGTW